MTNSEEIYLIHASRCGYEIIMDEAVRNLKYVIEQGRTNKCVNYAILSDEEDDEIMKESMSKKIKEKGKTYLNKIFSSIGTTKNFKKKAIVAPYIFFFNSDVLLNRNFTISHGWYYDMPNKPNFNYKGRNMTKNSIHKLLNEFNVKHNKNKDKMSFIYNQIETQGQLPFKYLEKIYIDYNEFENLKGTSKFENIFQLLQEKYPNVSITLFSQ